MAGMIEKKKLQKSYFDVLGLCCTSEVPLIEKILKPLEGVNDVSVIVPSKTVIVLHDNLLISQLQIVKALNQARLEANVRVQGGVGNYDKKWPSPYTILCGLLLLLSFLKYFYHPLQWLAIGSVAIGIGPIFMRGAVAVHNLTLDINILVIIAVVGSIVLRDYWEAASIVFLFRIAEWLESRASSKATAVMSSLMNIVPQKAILAESGEEVDADDVKIGTILAVKAGEIIPIDGVVVEGQCEVDEKTLTGESFPVSKQIESIVWAGTINLNGYISLKTTALAEDSVVARMAKLVEAAQNNKSNTQRLIDRCAKYYTPAIVVVSASLAVIPAALRLHNQNQWFHLALVVLVSACPCALVLSTPVATFCALSKAATSGLLIKGGEYLETLAKVKIMAFDKTGTITRGEFSVADFHPLLDDIDLETLLFWVSSIESKSSHPMAAALIEYGHSHSVEPKPDMVEEFQNFPGEGVCGKVNGKHIYVGNRKIAIRAGCETVPTLEGKSIEGKSVGYIFSDATPAGIFSLSDACRTGVKEAINELKSLGIRTAMLTGDSHTAAMYAQHQLEGALDEVHAELLPEDKARIIKHFQEEAPTAMIGDGMNDAPALATADIGISMGISGSALATETGHMILMSNDIKKIPKAARLARRTRRKIFENLILSITTKAAIIALAIAGHPLVWAAVLADVGTCLAVICNSMLLIRGANKNGAKCSKSHGHGHKHQHGHKDHSHSSHHHHNHGCSSTKAQTKCSSHKGCAPKCQPSLSEPHGCCAKKTELVIHDIVSEISKGKQSKHTHDCHGEGNCKKTVERIDRCAGDDGLHEANHCHHDHSDVSHGKQGQNIVSDEHFHAKSCAHEATHCHHGNHSTLTHGVASHSIHDHHTDVNHGKQGQSIVSNEHFHAKNCAHEEKHCHHGNHSALTHGVASHSVHDHHSDVIHGKQGQNIVNNEHFHAKNCAHEEKHCHHGNHSALTHGVASQSDHDHHSDISHAKQGQHIVSDEHCHATHCAERDVEASWEIHSECKKHGEHDVLATIDTPFCSNHGKCSSSSAKGCKSLEKRHVGGCCTSYRKECCGRNGHLGANLGGLSEIIIE